MAKKIKTLVFNGVAVELQYKTAHGGLVSASTMAAVTRAQSAIKKARGLDTLLTAIAPYVGTDSGEMAFQEAGKSAMKDGKLTFQDMQKLSTSEDDLEIADGEYFSVKLSSYCDILKACLDCDLMKITSADLDNLADTQTWNDIKEAVTDFLSYAGKK